MASLEHDPTTRNTVIPTGYFGNGGSFMLEQLLNDPQVAHIYCLNWSTGSESLQRTRNLGISSEEFIPLSTQLGWLFLTVDLTRSSYGLDPSIFDRRGTEWLPSLIASSRRPGALSGSLGGNGMEAIDWVPVDEQAVIPIKISEVIAWQDLVPAIVEELSTPEIDGDRHLGGVNHGADGPNLNEMKIDNFFVQGPTVWLLDFYQQLRVDGGDKGNYGRLAPSVCMQEPSSVIPASSSGEMDEQVGW
ncbi:hypothetical protein PEBR_22206 [Penicillium brasilianum]|uniref:Uncharacterized protein n=1 Tax=Penicillium brasilianum TaxID=104259 RepID=A0A1S9RN04_PENBI|nr:hypothetical protein PEBR_22206 [Penicillium brasilianum]